VDDDACDRQGKNWTRIEHRSVARSIRRLCEMSNNNNDNIIIIQIKFSFCFNYEIPSLPFSRADSVHNWLDECVVVHRRDKLCPFSNLISIPGEV